MLEEKIGLCFEAYVTDLASDGRGVLKHPSGRTFFVAGVFPGEKIVAKISQLKGRIGFAHCVEIKEKSQHRVEAKCNHHGFAPGKCGGCPWQSLSYDAQLEAKQQRVLSSFERIGLASLVKPIHSSEKTFAYRNRAQLKSDGQRIGYISAGTNTLAEIETCPILSDTNQQHLAKLQQQLPNENWRPRKKHKWISLDIDNDVDIDNLAINQRRPFRQANDEQNIFMRNWLNEKLLPLAKDSSVLELFSGSGNFTEIIAKQKFEKIYAADVVGEAIENLQKYGPENVTCIQEDLFLEKGLNKVLYQAKDAQVLVLDPPREGLKEKGNLFAKKSKLKQVCYISCDLATLVRDVSIFLENKFKVKEIQPLDQFPHTPHVELMVYMEK